MLSTKYLKTKTEIKMNKKKYIDVQKSNENDKTLKI